MNKNNAVVHRALFVLLALLLLGGYWLLPINGQVAIISDSAPIRYGAWPQTWVEPAVTQPGEQATLYVRDNTPWSYVKLVVDGMEAARDISYEAGSGPWTWRWNFTVPDTPHYQAVFYHDCHTGCTERARTALGALGHSNSTPPPARIPTKLGVVFADLERDWHGRAGWTVELTYAERQDDLDFSIDGLARRVYQANERGLRVLVRVDYDRGQVLPPTGDEVALQRFLDYCARLARDDRLRDVYAFFIGSGYNTRDASRLAPERPTTPAWYARVFNGYGLPPQRSDNVVQAVRAANPNARVLVGPVAPWNTNQNGDLRADLDAPWLNYFNTLVAHLDDAARQKSQIGIPLATPDGFALRAPGRPQAPEVANDPAQEPATDLSHPGWNGAQAGFRVYRDWLQIINRYPTTQGLPAYITSTNTYTGDTPTPPAQNYPAGWLTTALAEINREPQIKALCWFVDDPLDGTWAAWSLSRPIGQMYAAADEFDRLLQP